MKDNTADGSESVQEVLSSREGEDVGQAGDSQNRVHTGPSSNNSQATNPEVLDGLTTPPTSTSDGFSSQGTGHESQLSQLSQLSHLAAVQEPLNVVTRPTLSIVPSAGYKRTADGELKLETFKSPTSPYVRGHSRNVSAISNASTSSRIGELSSELRTRLSYAMVKVNHGWQANSIEEVESLASQKGSPTSSNSTLHGRRHVHASPRATLASTQGQTSNVSTLSQLSQGSGDFDLYSRTEPASRTYASFWADHSSASAPTYRQQANSPPSKFLAPSADIRPAQASRRSGTPKFARPPSVPGQGSNSSLLNISPQTPDRLDYRQNKIFTPSQKTIQEQDAIETLLFMSSPGNSGNMAHTFPPPRTVASPQRSPLRSEFHRRTYDKRVGFDETARTASTTSSENDSRLRVDMRKQRRPEGRPSKTQLRQKDAMDRMLDEIESSSDEDEALLNYASSRQFAIGRA